MIFTFLIGRLEEELVKPINMTKNTSEKKKSSNYSNCYDTILILSPVVNVEIY